MSSELEDKTAKYNRAKEAIEVLKARHAQELKPYMEHKEKLEGWLAEFLNKTGLKAAPTKQGNVHWTTKRTAVVKDPQAFMDHVTSTSEFHLLERRASVTAVVDYIEKHGVQPPGVSLNTYRSIRVSKTGEKE